MLRAVAFATFRRAPVPLLPGPTCPAKSAPLWSTPVRGYSSRPSLPLLAGSKGGKKRGDSSKKRAVPADEEDAQAGAEQAFAAAEEAVGRRQPKGDAVGRHRGKKSDDDLDDADVDALFEELRGPSRGGRAQQQRVTNDEEDTEEQTERRPQWQRSPQQQQRFIPRGAGGFAGQEGGFRRQGGRNNQNRNQGFRNFNTPSSEQARPFGDNESNQQPPQQQHRQKGLSDEERAKKDEERRNAFEQRQQRELQVLAALQSLAEDFAVIRKASEALLRSGKFGPYTEEAVTLQPPKAEEKGNDTYVAASEQAAPSQTPHHPPQA